MILAFDSMPIPIPQTLEIPRIPILIPTPELELHIIVTDQMPVELKRLALFGHNKAVPVGTLIKGQYI